MDGLNWSAICDAHKKNVADENYITRVKTGSQSVSREDAGIENPVCSEKLGPMPPVWVAKENGNETLLWP